MGSFTFFSLELIRSAEACPLCAWNTSSRGAYLIGTAILIAVPLVLIPLGILWIRRLLKKGEP